MDFIHLHFRKFGNASLFRRKGSDVENQDVDIEVKQNGKESVYKIIYKQVIKGRINNEKRLKHRDGKQLSPFAQFS